MRALRISAATALLLLVISVRSTAGDSPRAECSFNPRAFRSAEIVFHELSQRAELVAATTASSRRRTVVAPVQPPLTFTAKNFIDDEIFGKMVKDNVRWTSASTDEEFLRRVTLDLTGAIPDADTVKAFVADTSAGKREAVIDKLLASDGFTDRWTMWLGDHVQNVQTAANTTLQYGARNSYYHYLHDAIAGRKAYDEIVRDLIASSGDSVTNGAVIFWERQQQGNGPIQDSYDNLSAFTGDRFLALPLVCLSCHNGFGHLEQVNTGLSRRTRQDFWRNAAFFARSFPTPRRDPATNTAAYTMADFVLGDYKLNTTSGNKTPRQPQNGVAIADPAFFLTGETPQPSETRRQAYARMVTANPQFARATVNYIWKEIFGAGLVEPADSFDLTRQDPATLAQGATLQPTHPQLLTKLAESFIASHYDLRGLIRTIVVSNAYQLSSRYTPGDWNEAWAAYYARHYPRRLMAEEIFDAILKSTGVTASLGVTGGGSVPRAMLLPDPTEGGKFAEFLNFFERGNRDDEPRNSDSSIVQALALLDDRIVTDRVDAKNSASLVARLIEQSTDPATIAEGLYLNTLSRYPTADEKAQAAAYLKRGELARKTEDLQFALINKLEFLFN
ncbi:MAG TPA: DUF1553 domain-containing protein [Thermoanaerobaculia bacterium]|jgi:hypothetical protein|nr:DUF1553 domain-containing protein [Thermoanaerobaculia bacterium]